MNQEITIKVCSDCGKDSAVTAFTLGEKYKIKILRCDDCFVMSNKASRRNSELMFSDEKNEAIRAKRKKYYLENKAKINASSKKYFQDNKQRLSAYNKARKSSMSKEENREQSLRKYGLGKEAYDVLLESQCGVCAICGAAPKEKQILCVDHCHSSRKVRGLLCRNCNSGIGMLQDSSTVIERALLYIKRHGN